ncbi:ABC transporter permease [Kyrpidia spormannii]|uniref:ABC transporter permease n=1 Tax=Kyrpidia spormannii TaxID=2055160 RepID=A0A2K8N991_9BACL|nr:ABC transporter permease [Kyrpidia spormannii]ATY85899.1 ABC transporter permease [Kyrpidia spormannii]
MKTGELRRAAAAFIRDPAAMFGLGVLVITVAAALGAPWISPYDPLVGDGAHRLAPPGTPGHVLGLDDQGRDILSRLIWGSRTSLLAAVVPVVAAAAVSLVLGIVAGYAGGWVGTLLMRLVDVFFAFPAVLLAIAVAAVLGPGLLNVMIAMTVVRIPYMMRVVYTDTLQEKRKEYVESAAALGARPWEIMFRHLLPNVFPSLLVYAATLTGVSVVTAAGLSFIGLGVQPPAADWGRMASEGSTLLMQGDPFLTLFPGLAILLVSLAFSFVGDGLRDALDPRQRSLVVKRRRGDSAPSEASVREEVGA